MEIAILALGCFWGPGIRKSDSLIEYEKSGKSNIMIASIEKSSIEDY